MNRNFSTNDDCAINGEIDETETIEDKLKFNKEIILNVSLPSYRGPDANVFENNSEISNKITSYNLHTKDSEIKRNFSTSLFSNKTISPQTNRFAHYSPNVALLKESEEFNKFQLGSPRRSKHLQTDSKAGIKTRLSRYSMSQYKINKKISFDDQDVAMEVRFS